MYRNWTFSRFKIRVFKIRLKNSRFMNNRISNNLKILYVETLKRNKTISKTFCYNYGKNNRRYVVGLGNYFSSTLILHLCSTG